MADAKIQVIYARKFGQQKEQRYAVTAASVGDALELMKEKEINFDEYVVIRRPTIRQGRPFWGRYLFIKDM